MDDGVRQNGATYAADDVGLAAVLAPVVERWRLMMLVAFLAVGAVATFLLMRAPRYQARVVVATVSAQQGFSLGGAAALLGGAAAAPQGGLQVSPALIASLVKSRRVLTAVGTSTVPGGTERIVDRIAERQVAPSFIPAVMSRAVSSNVSKETGLVTVDVVVPDSALARTICERVIAATSRAYVETARAQATQLREAQELRVDSASRMLRRAEERLQGFMSGNRNFEDYSPRSTDLRSLQRTLTLAEGIYSKAVNDREAAVAKELENTPAVVVVDPLPTTLPRTPRRLALSAVLALLASVFLSLVWIFVAESFRRQERERHEEVERLRLAVGTIPLVGRLARRPERRASAPSS
jgi:uncharacterized protein involved in exopolysaccharide biosynthesis